MASFSVRIKNILKSYKKGFLMVLLLTLLSYIGFNLWNAQINRLDAQIDNLEMKINKIVNETPTLELFQGTDSINYTLQSKCYDSLLHKDIKILHNNLVSKDSIINYTNIFSKHFKKLKSKNFYNSNFIIKLIDIKDNKTKDYRLLKEHLIEEKNIAKSQMIDPLKSTGLVFLILLFIQSILFIIFKYDTFSFFKESNAKQTFVISFLIKIILISVFVYLGFFLPDRRHSNKEIPYNYYELIRFGAMVGFAVLGYFAKKNNDILFMFIWFSSALLVNPFAKLALGKELWHIIDIIWIVLLVVSIPYNLYLRNKSV